MPKRCGTDQHRQYRSRPHRLLQGQQERLLAVFTEVEVHDRDCAQNHPRPQRRCTRLCPRLGRYGSLPAVPTRAQEGRDAICAHETHFPARPVQAAGLERRQRRSATDSNRAKPETAGQASLPRPANSGTGLPRITAPLSVDSRQQITQRENSPDQTRKIQNQELKSKPAVFCNTIPPETDSVRWTPHV